MPLSLPQHRRPPRLPATAAPRRPASRSIANYWLIALRRILDHDVDDGRIDFLAACRVHCRKTMNPDWKRSRKHGFGTTDGGTADGDCTISKDDVAGQGRSRNGGR